MTRGIRIPAALLGAAIIAAAILPCLAVSPAKPAPQSHPEDTGIIRHLNSAITWYKELTTVNESPGEPSDAFYLDNARALATQVLQLAFQSADAEAALLSTEKAEGAGGGGQPLEASQDQQNWAKSAANIAAQISQEQSQIDMLNSQIPKTSGKKQQALISQRDSLQEQLDFNKVLQEALQKLSSFMSDNAAKRGGLQNEIDDLKKSVPELFAKIPAKEGPTPSTAPSRNPSPATGLFGEGEALFSRLGDMRQINGLMDDSNSVIRLAGEVQAPLRSRIRSTIDQGRNLASQPPAPNAAGIQAGRAQMASLTAQFKQISGATLPLAQEIIVIQETQASLRQWEASVHREYIRLLESFLARVIMLLIGMGIVFGFSELWRKATFRYVKDGRRRHQLLLIRRIVTAILMAIVIILGFISEFGSLATFAGFITAGIAVALQTLILSVAAYFFLIGRHGIRVGDRITVSGVTGDVIEVGLVRLYMMELGGAGADLHSTGRLVAVSNSVLFQGTPFFKQIPGTAYSWHEVAVKLDRGADYTRAENTLLEAVKSVYSQYRAILEEQPQALEGFGAVPASVPTPQAHVQLVENAVELVVRYPVVLQREAEINTQMAKKIMEVINRDPELKAQVGSPIIRPSSKA